MEGRPLGEAGSVERAAAAGLDPDRVRAGIAEERVKDRLRAYTDEARERGVMGIPTVALGEQLFWGDDRLEEGARAASGARDAGTLDRDVHGPAPLSWPG